MKKVVVFLLCVIIFVSPVTTFVKANVVIGDNDSNIVTDLGIQNGKRIAILESFASLLENGVTEINFENISDLDSYIDDFLDELYNIDYQYVSNEVLASAYYDIQSFKQWVEDRGNYISNYYKDYLNSADQGLNDIFNHFNIKLTKGNSFGKPLNGVRGMSQFNNNIDVNPDPDYVSYLNIINGPFTDVTNYNCDFLTGKNVQSISGNYQPSYTPKPIGYGTKWTTHYNGNNFLNRPFGCRIGVASDVMDININSDLLYVSYTQVHYVDIGITPYVGVVCDGFEALNYNQSLNCINSQQFMWVDTPEIFVQTSGFNDLESIFIYLAQTFKHVNIYVDGVPWSIVDIHSQPTLDIDGFLKLYNENQPVIYDFPKDIQIDYNALYNTIYNAIHDNLPFDMQTINNNQVYYDSHDTVYSPTIYNYYGKDGDNEQDWIDSILDYATIPDFNNALGVITVLDAPFINGVTILNTSVNDVLPNEILIIFGGCFVLILFVCIINKMTK